MATDNIGLVSAGLNVISSTICFLIKFCVYTWFSLLSPPKTKPFNVSGHFKEQPDSDITQSNIPPKNFLGWSKAYLHLARNNSIFSSSGK